MINNEYKSQYVHGHYVCVVHELLLNNQSNAITN
jgi:hypothetical protein